MRILPAISIAELKEVLPAPLRRARTGAGAQTRGRVGPAEEH
jgi:hypothetical protein